MAPSRHQYTNQPDPMDLWLDTQGYYRKSTARDGSCLYRAIAEQLLLTQKYHLHVRKQCVNYMRSHPEIFEGSEAAANIDSYLEHMLSPTQWGGPLELKAISELYQVDIHIFKEVGVAAEPATQNCFSKKIILCFSHDRHFDSVYLKEFTKIAGFCQALVYEILYKNVFGMKDVDYAVDKMLHYKPLRHRGDLGACNQRKYFNYSCNSIQLQRKGITMDDVLDDEVNVRDLLSKGITPFPYKVAKSLDPNIFRNVEFDAWIDYRRGLRHGFFGSNNELRVGVKCLVKMDEYTYVAHIQEMAPDKGPVVLFVEELGEKRTVPFETLELLPQDPPSAKPQISLTYHNQRYGANDHHPKSGSKSRKGKVDNEHKAKESASQAGHTQGSRVRSKSMQSNFSNITDHDQDSTSSVCHTGYETYPTSLEMGIAVPMQTVLVQPQHYHSPLLVPVSPRPEDVPRSWLTSHDSHGSSERTSSPSGGALSNSSQPVSPTDVFHFVPYSPPEASQCSIREETESADAMCAKDTLNQSGVDINSNYLSEGNALDGQINYNAPKSVLDSGADLPTDIQTLRFFYNLGNDVYRSQCGMYSWGASPQPCTTPCTPVCASTPGSPGMCAGKCPCGPVCITTVPTIHHLLEPSTPPSNTRRRRRDTGSSPTGISPISDNERGDHSSASSRMGAQTPNHNSHSSVGPRFKKEGKGKGKRDLKVYEGQPLIHQPTLQIPTTSSAPVPYVEDNTITEGQNDMSLSENSDHNTQPLAFSPSYGYVYYPSSPVVPFSPIESDPYYASFRFQYPEYTPETPQSPQCFSLSGGDMSMYGGSPGPQFPMYATSPTTHYLMPSSPGIYVGSPPGWTPVTPSTPQ